MTETPAARRAKLTANVRAAAKAWTAAKAEAERTREVLRAALIAAADERLTPKDFAVQEHVSDATIYRMIEPPKDGKK